MAPVDTSPRPRTLAPFGGLLIAYGDGVLAPRPWTLAQAAWATELLADEPPGPVLELGSGAGSIGLEVVRRTGRPAVLVDADPRAGADAELNAARLAESRAGTEVEVRCTRFAHALTADERFALVLADPPYVPDDEVAALGDPPHAVAGGDDGLDAARELLGLAAAHLAPGAPLLLQARGLDQLRRLDAWLERRSEPALVVDEVRAWAPDRAIGLFRHRW